MHEKVVVNNGIPHYLPELKNPTYRSLEQRRAKLREEAIFRIKSGDFDSLCSLIANLNLTLAEIDDILVYWKENNQALLHIYYEGLISNIDLKKLSLADSLYQCYKLQVEAEANRQK